MKILTTMKRVPDPDLKLKITADGTGIEQEGIKYIPNYFDEIAVEEALRIKANVGGDFEIIVVAAGPQDTQQQIRSALAMGADKGIHVKTDDYVDSDAMARIVVEVYKKENPDFILMGKLSTDEETQQEGQLIAAYLDLSQATFASEIEIKDGAAVVKREIDGGMDEVEVSLPCVITTDLRLNEPRYATLPNIMKAKRKPIEAITPEELGVDITSKVKILKIVEPPPRKAGIKVDDVATLVDKLVNEAKVIGN